jgi:4-hydroxy-tetrahydrodipicolinate synthase
MARARDEVQAALAAPIPSIRTPFDRDGEIDHASLKRMVDFYVRTGSTALLITWGDSLFSVLGDREIAELTRAVVTSAAGRAVVVACTGRWATVQAVEFARFCREAGAEVLQVCLPFWYPGASTSEAVVAHHAAIAAEIPLMANSGELHRNGPGDGRAAAGALVETVGNVVAMKADVTGEFDRAVTSLAAERWAVLAGGQKSFHQELWPYGCRGYLSTFATFRPGVARAYWKAVCAGDRGAAVRIIERIDRPFFEYILASPGGFDAAIHGVMELSGLAQRWRRPPFRSLRDEEMERLADLLARLAEAEREAGVQAT